MNPRVVLVIEDKPEWIDAFVRCLCDSEVLSDGGYEYLSIIESRPDIELVVLDYNLKQTITGGYILREIRRIKPSLCVALMSAEASGFTAGDAIDLANGFISKESFISYDAAVCSILVLWRSYMKRSCSPLIQTEWDDLRTVIVHRPTNELKCVNAQEARYLMPQRPDIALAGEQHEAFVAVLQKSNVRVLDTRRLAEDVFSLAPADEREQLLAEIVLDESEQELWRIFKETGQTFPSLGAEALQDMKGATPDEIVTRLYEGWSSTNWKRYSTQFGKSHVPLLLEMCNAYFTRDPGFTLNGLFVVSSMTRRIRQREARLLDVILRQHPWFSDDRSVRYPVQSFVRADPPNRIEGGDVVAIGPGELAIGLSERTSFEAIEALSRHLLVERDYQRIYVVPIPRTFAYMHLDTVFSLVSSDTAVCYPAAIGSNFLFFYFERSPSGKDIVLSNGTQPFLVHLQDKMGFKLVETAGGHPGLAMAEQYGDATNTLAIGNGRVIAYAENHTTNDCLRNAGIEVIEIKGSELVKGVGGPRCMTMPVQRGT